MHVRLKRGEQWAAVLVVSMASAPLSCGGIIIPGMLIGGDTFRKLWRHEEVDDGFGSFGTPNRTDPDIMAYRSHKLVHANA